MVLEEVFNLFVACGLGLIGLVVLRDLIRAL